MSLWHYGLSVGPWVGVDMVWRWIRLLSVPEGVVFTGLCSLSHLILS